MRKHYLDNIKWIVQILVVLYHLFFMYASSVIALPSVYGQITKEPFLLGDIYQYAVYPWFMTVLFIVSGITAKIYLDNHTTKEFIGSRTTKFLVPSTIGVLVFGYVQGYLNMSLSEGAFDSMKEAPALVKYLVMCVSGTGVLWFLQVLWVLSIVLVIVRKIEKDRLWKVCAKTNMAVLLLMAVPFYGAGLILNTPVITVYRFGLYGIAFFTGYFIFSHEEVIARIKAVYRRVGQSSAESEVKEVKYDKLSVNMTRYELRVNGQVLDTPPKELELLFHLASNPNRVYTRDQLLDEVWGFEYYGDSRTIDVHVKRLREKLEGVSDKWALKTVWGVGYKFEVAEGAHE